MNVLKKVTDRFNIFNDGRKLGANKRNYVLSSVKQMLSSPETQERIRLGEAFGYYGHQPRERAKKLMIGETEIINVNGKPVVVDNVPANRTTSISIDDDGTVTHEQEFLDTPTGRIALSLHESKAGGWSWATSGRDGMGKSIARTFAGIDYVLKPNYLSLDHPQMMLESAEEHESMLLESVAGAGVDEEHCQKIIEIGMRDDAALEQVAGLEQEAMYLEGVIAEKEEAIAEKDNELQSVRDELAEQKAALDAKEDLLNQRGKMMLEAAKGLPIFISEEQELALSRMETEEDVKTVQLMFESVSDPKLQTLPMGANEPAEPPKPAQDFVDAQRNNIDFGMAARRFG